MSSVVVPTSAALGRPFLFDAQSEGEVSCHPERSGKCAKRVARAVEGSLPSLDPKLAGVIPASRLEARPAPEMVTSGIAEIDALTGGLPRGCLTEIYGTASSGRTSVMLAALAAATRRGEYCALIDASDALDPQSVASSEINLDRLLWVRCSDDAPKKSKGNNSPTRIPTAAELGFTSRAFDFQKKNAHESEHRLEQVLRATDLLLESGGFGLIVLDLAEVLPQAARRIPLTTWFRFRRAVEHKPTMLLVMEQQPIAGSCSSLLLRLGVLSTQYSVLSSNRSADESASSLPSHAQLLTGLEIHIELIRSRLERKPAQSVMFETQAAWAG